MAKLVSDDPFVVKDFIEDNFVKFVDKVNEDTDSNWKAQSIEKSFPIIINYLGNEINGVFLDFNDENGYAVLGDSYKFYDFVLNGESPYINVDANEYYYANNKYFYKRDSSEIIDVNEERYEQFFCETVDDGHAKDATGCGKIIDVEKYLNYHYGSDYNMISQNSLNMTGYEQYPLSIYYENRIINNEKRTYSEGNCWAVSAYNLLQYLQQTRMPNMPSANDTYQYSATDWELRIFKNYYEVEIGHNGRIVSTKNITGKLNYGDGQTCYRIEAERTKKFPRLWADIRKYCNDKWGKINSGMLIETSEIIEVIANKYGYNIDAKEHYDWAYYYSSGCKEIDNGKPLLWSTSTGTYGSHTMAVCGYKTFEKKTGWWIFQSVDTKVFYELRDGHSPSARYYDMSGHIGFAGIVSVEIW